MTPGSGPSLGFPCFCKAWDPTALSDPGSSASRLHMLLFCKSLSLSWAARLAGPAGHIAPHGRAARAFRQEAAHPCPGISYGRGALLERPTGRVTLTAPSQSPGCSRADVPSKLRKKPKNVSAHKGAGASLQQELIPPHRTAALPGAAALAHPWKSLSSLEAGSWMAVQRDGGERASEHSPQT